MYNRRIGLLDIGLDAGFDASMMFVQSTIQSINAGYEKPIAEVDFVRSRDPLTVAAALTAPCHVLHVMAHGNRTLTPTFSSSDGMTEIALEDLGAWAAEQGFGIGSSAVLADGCRTGTGIWQKAVRDCLQGNIAYIGTSVDVGWHEGTVFASAFYGALFRNKGKGATPEEQAVDAAERAIKAYELLTDRQCPYRILELTPSLKAKKLLDGKHK